MRPHSDLYLAALICIFSTIGAGISYTAIRLLELPERSFHTHLALGQNTFIIKQGERCVGALSLSAERKHEWTISTGGKILARHGDLALPFDIVGFARFNPLRQLTEAKMSFKTIAMDLEFGAYNVSPLTLRIKARFGDNISQREIQIPGPLLLRESDTDELVIHYPLLATPHRGALALIGNFLEHNLNFQLHRQQNDDTSCKGHEYGSVNLVEFFSALKDLKLGPLHLDKLLEGSNTK